LSGFLRLLFVVPVAYILAIIAATATIVTGWAGFGADPFYAGLYIGGVLILIASVGSAAFLPAVVAIAAAEIFRWRSVFYYLVIGGLIGFAAHQLAGFTGTMADFEQRQLLFPAAGFVGAFVYWLIAGRLAGGPPSPEPPASAPPTSSV
jgi:hypothetical protein